MLVAGLLLLCLSQGCSNSQSGAPAEVAADVIVEDLVVGTGNTVLVPDTNLIVGVVLDYTGYFSNGEIFDSSFDRGIPFALYYGEFRIPGDSIIKSTDKQRFWLGQSRSCNVIRGWQSGLVGMREGGRRRLIIPPERAYEDRGWVTCSGGGSSRPRSIPSGATLTFVIDCVRIDYVPSRHTP